MGMEDDFLLEDEDDEKVDKQVGATTKAALKEKVGALLK